MRAGDGVVLSALIVAGALVGAIPWGRNKVSIPLKIAEKSIKDGLVDPDSYVRSSAYPKIDDYSSEIYLRFYAKNAAGDEKPAGALVTIGADATVRDRKSVV